ncbi:MAG: hypothetical protein Ta2E_01630 [Mycoplasmoidaceae bacterium]|nr:MAG: hypothetical protein Ta2E_01630 [Mycoplasmoidaceae bacterium]
MNVLRGIDRDEDVIANNKNVITDLLEWKIKTKNIDEIKSKEHEINYFGFVTNERKTKKVIKIEMKWNHVSGSMNKYYLDLISIDEMIIITFISKSINLSFLNLEYDIHSKA